MSTQAGDQGLGPVLEFPRKVGPMRRCPSQENIFFVQKFCSPFSKVSTTLESKLLLTSWMGKIKKKKLKKDDC